MEKIMFGAGCFWGVEVAFKKLEGVTTVQVGYSGGHTKNPNYEQICSGDTGHAEVAYVEYNPQLISTSTLLENFWQIHDPTSLNKQGPDVGTQYRSAIYYYTDDQKQAIESSLHKLSEKLQQEIVTEVAKASDFWPAEEYHQCYLEKKGHG
ncbi:MAG: peptide-methionine (S)-S-oxide reductase MsrA [Bdellovibrionales bacterium]|nr:peptide-methionine (S)-S-oxide reductase MsrA [Bdellovibrionales bacterium]